MFTYLDATDQVIVCVMSPRLEVHTSMYELKEKVALVTGGAAGIGGGVVSAFLEEQAKHIAILDVDVGNGKALEKELSAKHGPEKVKFYKCDVTTDELVSSYDSVLKQFGYIDVVVNCAGIMNDKLFMKAIDINVGALIRSSLKAYELMRKDQGGRGGTIINISSIAGLLNSPYIPVYCATKSAVLQFSQSLGMEPTYSRTGVRVITMCFGITNTSMLTGNKTDVFDKVNKKPWMETLDRLGHQKLESAVQGLVQAYKQAGSATTWLATSDEPVKNITDDILEGYKIMSRSVPLPTKN